MQNFKISIPEPCHENWQKMTPQDKGRFCNACSKVVIDFTQMTEEEIIHFFQKHQNQAVCGRAKQTQLNKVYKPQNFLEKHYIHVYQNYRKSWIGNKYLSILSFILLITGCQSPENQTNPLVQAHTETFKHISNIINQNNKKKEIIIQEAKNIEEVYYEKELPYAEKCIAMESELGGVIIMKPVPDIEDSLEHHKNIKIDTIHTENLLSIADSSFLIVSLKNKNHSKLNIYPNPAQDKATIQYFLEADSEVKIYLLNNNGHLVKEFLHEAQTAGEHHLDIEIENLPSGIYFYTIETSLGRESKRFVISK
ncbi:MAG: T9SS type A sorting domain-containing protein [Raineya sp.]|jgi:hypothetical protein|nr:T9SS type A sorting domain-containing protein [Raineya sp.]